MTQPPLLTGLVLAGGLSERMGVDKAALQIDGLSLLDHAVNTLRAVVPDVFVSIRDSQRDDATRQSHALIADLRQGIGPAAGILSAYLAKPECAWLVIGCDMPLLTTGILEHLISARDSALEATVWASGGDQLPEPLCAIYEPATLAAFWQSVESGGNPSPRAWLAGRAVRLLESSPGDALRSANTRQEFQDLLAKRQAGQ